MYVEQYAAIHIHVFGCGKKFKCRSVESMSASHYEVVVLQKSRQVFALVNRCVACLNNVLICWSKKSPRGRCPFFRIVKQALAQFQILMRKWI